MVKSIRRDESGNQWISISEAARRLSTTTTVLKKTISEEGFEISNFRNGKTVYILWADFTKLVKRM